MVPQRKGLASETAGNSPVRAHGSARMMLTYSGVYTNSYRRSVFGEI